MLQRRSFSSLLLLAATFANGVLSQQPELQDLGDVLHLMLDKDKDEKVTMDEVNSQMTMLGALFGKDEGQQGLEFKQLLDGVKSWAPSIFELLDANGDKGVSKSELKYATKFEKSVKKDGGLRDLVRDVFSILDSDGDDKLSVDELLEGSKSSDVITKVTVRFHKLFPLRKTPEELEDFVKDTVESIGGNTLDKESVTNHMQWIDDDGDGYIQRKEVGKYYNIAGKKFITIAKTIKQMGPMMAMFGGMNDGGGNGGFKMDL